MSRDQALRAFVARHGHDPAKLSPLAGDASNRRYLRLAGATPLVVMDAPPERGEDTGPFSAMTTWLRGQGFSAPRIHAADPQAGFLILEDLGDALFARLCALPDGPERLLYETATDLLVALHKHPAPATLSDRPLAAYDLAVLLREARLAVDWYLPAALGHPADGRVVQRFLDVINQICAPVAQSRDAVVLRDYHAENLLWLPDRTGLSRVGLLDYQDALAGHPAYDLVSLLEDARRDTSPTLQEAMIVRYLTSSGVEAEPFRAAYAILGAQRNLKIIGIFTRLCLRDDKPRYPDLIPRVWAHLERDLSHPATAPLAEWAADCLPPPSAEVLAAIKSASGRRKAPA